MKKVFKNISLFLVVIMILAVSFGCTPKDSSPPPAEVVDNDDPQDNKDPVKEPEGIIIEVTDKVDITGLSLLDSYKIDINGDGNEEIIAMYVNAEQGPDGEIYWDDGQNWLFLVQDTDKDYVLFSDYVQLGSIKFHIYTSDDDFKITTIQTSTASLKLTEYSFHKESNSFVSNVKFETSGNVNMLHSSYGY